MMYNRYANGGGAQGGGPCADTRHKQRCFFLVFVCLSWTVLEYCVWALDCSHSCFCAGPWARSIAFIHTSAPDASANTCRTNDQDPLRVQYGRTGGGGPWLLRGLLQGKFPTYQSFITHDGLLHDTELEMERRCPRSRHPPASKRLRLAFCPC